MKKTQQKASTLSIKALVTENGNYLVNFQGNFFYMDPAGNYQESKYEQRNPGRMLKSQEWAWLKGLVKEAIVLNEKEVKLAEKVKNDLLLKNKPVIANVQHSNTPLSGLEALAEK